MVEGTAKAESRRSKPKGQSAVKQLRVTLVKSRYGRLEAHRACVAGLGLRRMNHTVTVADTPQNRGMINKVSYLLRVEEL